MKVGPKILRRVIEATLLGLAVGDAIGYWRNRDQLAELDEQSTLLDARLDAIESIPGIQHALTDTIVRRRPRESPGEDSAQCAERNPG